MCRVICQVGYEKPFDIVEEPAHINGAFIKPIGGLVRQEEE
jgi:hypothetical protein